ncbi:hypothetical protein VTP01DRAFT_10693 [Rhizomucor pusillus]|uniref:uncharacterized protein n=1 Tax=Rhizomucor pusillus TaxID=4840 RepID=UPI00374443AA
MSCNKLSFAVAKRRGADYDTGVEYKDAKGSSVAAKVSSDSPLKADATKSATTQRSNKSTTRKRSGDTHIRHKKRSRVKRDKAPVNNRSIKEFLASQRSNSVESSSVPSPANAADASSPRSTDEPLYFKIREPRAFCEVWESILSELLDYPTCCEDSGIELHKPAALRKCPTPYKIEDYYGDKVTMTLLQALETDDPSEDYSRRVRNRMTAKESADYIARIAEELLS